MPGAGLSCRRSGKAPLGKPAFQPYWGKPAVRNDREDRGNVGIIRSPVRASILPDRMRHGMLRIFALQTPFRPAQIPDVISQYRRAPEPWWRQCDAAISLKSL